MIYVFKDNTLFDELPFDTTSISELNSMYPKSFPTDCYIYDDYWGSWFAKRTRTRVNHLPEKYVPKELKVICLLLGIQIGGS